MRTLRHWWECRWTCWTCGNTYSKDKKCPYC